LQAALHRLYQLTPRGAEVRNDQSRWQMKNPASMQQLSPNLDQLDSLKERINEIYSWTEKTKAILSRRFTLNDIAKKCIAVPPPGGFEVKPDCRVDEFGRIDEQNNFRYQIYLNISSSDPSGLLSSGDLPATTVVLFSPSRKEDEFEIVGWADKYTRKPYSTSWRQMATLLVLPDYEHGSGGYVYDRAYILEQPENVWHEIDVNSWEEDIAVRLPPGLTPNRGHHVDYEQGIGQVFLARKTDPNCCPTGGRAVARLVIRDRRMTIEDFRIVPEVPSFTGPGGVVMSPSLR
jgi:hypothetical protein